MADVLALLRDYNLNNKHFLERNDEIIFGDFAWPKSARTNYVVWGTGKDGTSKDYYTLDCVVYLLKHIDLPHAQYVRQAANAEVPVVRLPDRKDLLAFLKGENASAANIDRTAPVDISLRRLVVKSELPLEELRDGEPEAKLSRYYDGSRDPPNSNLGRESHNVVDDPMLDLDSHLTVKIDHGALPCSLLDSEKLKGSSLSEAMSIDKIQDLRAKVKAKQQRIVQDDAEFSESTPGNIISDVMKEVTTLKSSSIMDSDFSAPYSKTLGLSTIIGNIDKATKRSLIAADEKIVRGIALRERKWRTRTTSLQSQGKCFYDNIVLGILRNVMIKENAPEQLQTSALQGKFNPSHPHHALMKGISQHNPPSGMALSTGQPRGNSNQPHLLYSRYDQEKFANKQDDTAGFSIDTMASFRGKGLASMVAGNINQVDSVGNLNSKNSVDPRARNSSLYSSDKETSKLVTPKDPRSMNLGTPDPYRQIRSTSEARMAQRAKARSARVPIIIIPATTTSLITMYNAKDILQEMSYVSSSERQSQGTKREPEILIQGKKVEGKITSYRVVDQPQRLTLEEWDRVVAVFIQGQQWQFKGWPIGSDPAIIFSLLKGFHLKYSNVPVEPNVSKWNVKIINLDRRKRHLDKANFQSIWDQIDKHIAKCKPNLR